MQIFTFSQIIMTIITCNLLIIMCSLLLKNITMLVRIGYRILAIIICFIILRMVFTLEFSFTHNVMLSKEISKIIVFLKHPKTAGSITLSPWNFFQGIWLAGIIFFLLKYIHSYQNAKKWINLYGKNFSKSDTIYSILQKICSESNRKNNFSIKEIQGIRSPMIFGILSPQILLPESPKWTLDELDIILRHETAHYFHYDLLLKAIVKIITIIYWWNPFCHILNIQADLIMDIHIDSKLVSNTKYTKKEYMNCLLRIAQVNEYCDELPHNLTISFCRNKSFLMKRFLVITSSKPSKITLQVPFLLISLGILLTSYLFILEASYLPQHIENSSMGFGNENDYVIQRNDGTFEVYLNNHLIETTTSLKYYEMYDFIIYNEKGEIINEN